MMLTINETAKKTGLSSYEIRQRVLNGRCPHIRVGAKKTKILIDYDLFGQIIRDENLNNMQAMKNISESVHAAGDSIGYGKLRQIN